MFWGTACDIVSSGMKSLSYYLLLRARQLSKPELASSKTSSGHQATTQMSLSSHQTNKIGPLQIRIYKTSKRAGDIACLIECWPSMQEILDSIES